MFLFKLIFNRFYKMYHIVLQMYHCSILISFFAPQLFLCLHIKFKIIKDDIGSYYYLSWWYNNSSLLETYGLIICVLWLDPVDCGSYMFVQKRSSLITIAGCLVCLLPFIAIYLYFKTVCRCNVCSLFFCGFSAC